MRLLRELRQPESGLISFVEVTTDQVVTEDGAGTLPPRHLVAGKIRFRAKLILFGLLAGIGYLGFRFGPDAYSAYRAGFFEKGAEKHAYVANRKENLEALRRAIMLYHDSEQMFPDGSGWMTAIKPYLDSGDLKDGEANKKLHRPGTSSGFGYAMNDALARKYVDDVPEGKKQIVIFESSESSENAHGSPSKIGSGLGIQVDGTIVELKSGN